MTEVWQLVKAQTENTSKRFQASYDMMKVNFKGRDWTQEELQKPFSDLGVKDGDNVSVYMQAHVVQKGKGCVVM